MVLECSYNEVVYKDEDLQAKVEKVLEHIAWLLEEVQKPDSALDIEKEGNQKGKVNRQSCRKGKLEIKLG